MISTDATIDMSVWEGATFYREFTWEIGDPALPVDLTDFTAKLQARDDIADETPVIDLSSETGGIITVSYTHLPSPRD